MFITPPKIIRAFFPSLIWRKENQNKNIWITFDDGPCPITTPFILKTLKKTNIKATFFLIGEQIEKYPNLAKKIREDGHVIGNHTYSHKNGWWMKNSNYCKDVEKCQKLIPNNKLLRPPYGKITPLQIKKLKTEYKIILWDVLSWDFHPYVAASTVKDNVLKNTSSGSILVFHNNLKSLNTLKLILQETIQKLQERNFLFSITW